MSSYLSDIHEGNLQTILSLFFSLSRLKQHLKAAAAATSVTGSSRRLRHHQELKQVERPSSSRRRRGRGELPPQEETEINLGETLWQGRTGGGFLTEGELLTPINNLDSANGNADMLSSRFATLVVSGSFL